MRTSCWTCASFPNQDVKYVPLLSRIVCKLQSYRIKNKQKDWCRIELSVEITFVRKKKATEWIEKALHHIDVMIEEKVPKCKK